MNPRDPNLQLVEQVARALDDELCEELLVEEAALAGDELTNYLAAGFRDIVKHPDFENTLPGLVEFDPLYEERVRRVRDRIDAMTRLDAI